MLFTSFLCFLDQRLAVDQRLEVSNFFLVFQVFFPFCLIFPLSASKWEKRGKTSKTFKKQILTNEHSEKQPLAGQNIQQWEWLQFKGKILRDATHYNRHLWWSSMTISSKCSWNPFLSLPSISFLLSAYTYHQCLVIFSSLSYLVLRGRPGSIINFRCE